VEPPNYRHLSPGSQYRYQPTPDENVTSPQCVALKLRASTSLATLKGISVGAERRKPVTIVCWRTMASIVWPDCGIGSRRRNSRLCAADNIRHDGPDFLR
jgi:hypothetical protein